MGDKITKEDLREFGLQLMEKLRVVIQNVAPQKELNDPQWLKSRMVRKMLDISPGSLQNLRITGKIKFKKVMGSYYYCKEDINKLFKDERSGNGDQ